MLSRSAMCRSRAVSPIAVLSVMCLAGCGSAQVHGQVSTSVTEGDDRKYENPEPSTPPKEPAPVPVPVPVPEDHAHFLGVSHDLSLAGGVPRTATCQCLMVAVGAPNDPKFVWQGGPPKVDADTLAVAIASDGVACAVAGLAPLRASISGVEAHGNDVVLSVENVREGKPVMRGALVARPAPGSSIVVVGKKGTPYGTPPQGGAGGCRVAMK
jgi:hypothetical protein